MPTLREADVHTEVSFTDREARFLAMAMENVAPRLTTDEQIELLRAISGKFVLAGEAAKRELVAKYGIVALLEYADAHSDETGIERFADG